MLGVRKEYDMRFTFEEWDSDMGIALIKQYAREGLTNSELAKRMGTSVSTLRRWRNKSAAIDCAVKEGKEIPDARVEDSLFQRAVGMSYTETKTVTKDILIDGIEAENLKQVETVEYTKYALPDTTAQIFWLRNRNPKRWSNNPEGSNIDNTVNIVIDESLKKLGE